VLFPKVRVFRQDVDGMQEPVVHHDRGCPVLPREWSRRRFLCSTFGSAGDVFPMLGLALALRDHGHEIVFATNDHFRTLIESHGLPFEPLGIEADYQACIRHPDLWDPQRAFAHIFRCFSPILRRQYDLHAEALVQSCEADDRPQAVAISNCLGFGALLARERLNVPLITLHVQPAVIWSAGSRA
jgi:rhamnosyltransferase subunit B